MTVFFNQSRTRDRIGLQSNDKKKSINTKNVSENKFHWVLIIMRERPFQRNELWIVRDRRPFIAKMCNKIKLNLYNNNGNERSYVRSFFLHPLLVSINARITIALTFGYHISSPHFSRYVPRAASFLCRNCVALTIPIFSLASSDNKNLRLIKIEHTFVRCR